MASSLCDKQFFSFNELQQCSFLIRAVIVALVAYICAVISHGGYDWYKKNVNQKYMIKNLTLSHIGWVLFYLVFAYMWYKITQLVPEQTRQLVDMGFLLVLVLLVTWNVSLYRSKDLNTSRWLIGAAAIVLGIMVLVSWLMWGLHPYSIFGLVLLLVWVIYQYMITMPCKKHHRRRRDGNDEESCSDSEEEKEEEHHDH